MDERILNRSFFQIVDTELKRAERYQIFVSMIILDLSVIESLPDETASQTFERVYDLVGQNIRVVDQVSRLGTNKIVVLLPETSRQGAEMAARRLSEMIKEDVTRVTSDAAVSTIPVEMASFPDAAGARSVKEVLQDLSNQNVN